MDTHTIWLCIYYCWSVLNILSHSRFICDFRYFGVFHILAVFIVLGIGADDIFVFFDTWKESGFKSFPSLAHRLSYAYKRAARAMFFTSITTATAFIVSAASPFLGISSFGVFSGILILVNYMSVIIFVPTVIVTYHVWWAKNCCCCCCPRDAENGGTEKKRWPVRFFGGPYFRFITNKVTRWIILFCIAGFTALMCYQASHLEVQDEQVNIPISFDAGNTPLSS